MARDHLTGALDGRAWKETLATENDRCRRHDTDATVAVVDVDASFDRREEGRSTLLRECVAVLIAAVRAHDVVARPRPSEIAVLAVDVDADAAHALERRIARLLADTGVRAAVGAVQRAEVGALDVAWVAARERMMRRRSIDPVGWT
jgi:diguanylate cyclase